MDLDEIFLIQVKGQEVIGDNYKILLHSIYLAYHYVKSNKGFRNIGSGYEKFVAELQIWGISWKISIWYGAFLIFLVISRR